MRSPSIIPPDVLRLQGEVSDPAVSAWVAANAGSGKTHVLAQRVINLLLAGVEPEKILCITFTKAAAANMAKRVFDTLGRWTTLDDAALDDAIGEQLRRRAARAPAGRWRGGCLRARWRRRAASRCRPSTPSARSSCISFRSKRTSPPASPCSTRPSNRSCWKRLTLAVLLEGAAARREPARPRARHRHDRRRRPDLPRRGARGDRPSRCDHRWRRQRRRRRCRDRGAFARARHRAGRRTWTASKPSSSPAP